MNKTTLYLECYSGISGDMAVASLLDLGADQNRLMETLKSLHLPGFEIKITRVKKAGLDCCDFDVVLDSEHENHDHDMNYLHGAQDAHVHSHHQEDEHMHEHSHHHEDEHMHEHSHHHGDTQDHVQEPHEHHHAHEHRGLPEILAIIKNSDMTEHAKALATKIFDILAQAEAKAHGVAIEDVHFHEVGAVDSIVDICAFAICYDNLGITDTVITRLCEGQGVIRCQHGIIPVPVPAVANIVSMCGLNLQITETQGELVTPTGAAIAAAIRTSTKLPENFTMIQTGLGAGKRTYDRPSLVRAMLIQPEENETSDYIYKLESNIDDCTGENLGYVMDRLLEAGARDVHYTPVFMKKNRPAYQLNIVCKEEDVDRLEQIVFAETTTIGIRRMKMERSVLQRRIESIQTSIGKATVKVCTLENGKVKVYPEYESVRALCQELDMSYTEVYDLIKSEYLG